MLARALNEDCLEHVLLMCDPETLVVLSYVPELVPPSLLKKYSTVIYTHTRYMLCYSATNGYLELFKWFLLMKHQKYNSNTCCVAAKNGHLNILKYVRERGLCTVDTDYHLC